VRPAATAVVVAFGALVLLAGCKKKSSGDAAVDVAKFGEFTDRLCACKDKACGESVQEEMTRWSAEMAKRGAGSRPDEAMVRKMTEVGQRYGACITRVMSAESTAPATEPGKPLLGDALVKQAFDEAGAAHTVTSLQISYMREDGVIDPTYGTAEVSLGKRKAPSPADDPKRPIGAPVAAAPLFDEDPLARCPAYSWKAGVRTKSEGSCISLGELARPHCSVVEVWKQAIEAGAPAQGLAVLSLQANGPDDKQYWSFSIEDAPRDIHFSKTVPDVCDPTLEKPVAVPPDRGL